MEDRLEEIKLRQKILENYMEEFFKNFAYGNRVMTQDEFQEFRLLGLEVFTLMRQEIYNEEAIELKALDEAGKLYQEVLAERSKLLDELDKSYK